MLIINLLCVSATNNNPQTSVFDNSYCTWDSKFHINMMQELMAIKLTVVSKEKSVALNVCD